jgi:acyl carrier protein
LSKQAVVASIADTLRDVDTGTEVSFDQIDESTELLGNLDSLGLVTLVVDLEERLLDDFGVAVALASERALSRKQSPYRTVGTLSDYVVALAAGDEPQ